MFTIYSDSGSDSTMVSNLFIDEYMKSANDAQIKVYLYLLRVMGAHRATSVSDMADRFNHTEKDVVRSLRYWEKKGLLNLTFDKKEDLVSICLCRPESAETAERSREQHVLPFAQPDERQQPASGAADSALRMAVGGDRPAAALSGMAGGIIGEPGTSAGLTVPSLSQDSSSASALITSRPGKEKRDDGNAAAGAETACSEREALESFRSSAERAQLLFVIEQYIGKPLSLNEIRIIYTISEKLHFSDDLLDYLVQYCVDRGKKDFRYIRKVAENWAAQGIMTPVQAESTSAAEDGTGVRKAAGSTKRSSAGKSPADSGAGGKEKAARRTRSSNSFNQFQQNSYDFDALEEELLTCH